MTTRKTGADAALQFLSALFRRSRGPVFFISFGNADTTPPQIVTREKDAVVRFIRQWDRPGHALHFCLTTLKRGPHQGKLNLDELVALAIDLDFKNIDANPRRIERAIEALPLRPQLVVFSGTVFTSIGCCESRCRPRPRTSRASRQHSAGSPRYWPVIRECVNARGPARTTQMLAAGSAGTTRSTAAGSQG